MFTPYEKNSYKVDQRSWSCPFPKGCRQRYQACPYCSFPDGCRCPNCFKNQVSGVMTTNKPVAGKMVGGADNRQKIIDFFKQNPNPSDKQIHKLANDMGVNAHVFEEQIYRLLSEFIQKM